MRHLLFWLSVLKHARNSSVGLFLAVRVLGIVWISSRSFRVEIVLHLFFFFLVSLLYEECFDKFSYFFSTDSTGWGIGSASLSIFVGVV